MSFKRGILVANFIFLISSLVFCTVIFSHIKPNQFLLVHDQATWISSQHLSGGSFIRSPDSGGIALEVQTAMNLPNRTIYSLLFGLGLSARNVQLTVFVLCLYLFLSISFYAFNKINGCWNKLNYDRSDFFNTFVATLFYCFGFLSILYINSGCFWSLDFVLAYSFFPLIFYYVIEFLESGTLSNRKAILFAFALAVSANHIVFLIPLAVGVLVFLLSRYSLKDCLKIDIKKIFFVLILFFLLSSHLWMMYVFETRYNTGNFTETALRESTAGSLRGGFLYQFLNYFSWALYIPWKPRSILTFDKYFLSNLYATVFLSIYAVILFFLVKNKNLIKKALPFLSVLLVSAFFGKGPQPPLGFIYSYLVTHFSPFAVVRSPDNKFALGVVFAVAVLVLLVLRSCKGKRYASLFRLYFLVVVIAASYPLVTGEAVLGRDIPDQSGSFVTEVFPEYQEVLNILNQDDELSSVLVQPPLVMPALVHNGKIFIGQDVLRAGSKKPFIYEDFDFREVKGLNARYIVIRKDVYKDSDRRSVDKFREGLTKSNISRRLIDNDYLELYEVEDQYFLPHFYIPRGVAYLSGSVEALPEIMSFDDYELRTGVYLENSGRVLERADEVFVEGERLEPVLRTFEPEWEEGWAWPEANVDPRSWKYPLVQLKERWVEWRAREPLEKADVLLWHGVKRIQEINEGEITEIGKLTDAYLKDVGRVVEILKGVPVEERDEEFWGMAGKTLAYMKRVGEEIKGIEEIGKLHDEFREWAEEILPVNLCSGKYCFEVEVPEAGEYEIYVNKAGWVNFGSKYFAEGKHVLKLEHPLVGEGVQTEPGIILKKLRNLGTAEIEEIPKITFVKVNPTKYRVKVEGAKEPYTLIFSESFHPGWKIYKKEITEINEIEADHLLVNGYANSWYIEPEDVGGATDYELIIEFWPQRLFYIGLFVSLVTLLGCLGYLGYDFVKRWL